MSAEHALFFLIYTTLACIACTSKKHCVRLLAAAVIAAHCFNDGVRSSAPWPLWTEPIAIMIGLVWCAAPETWIRVCGLLVIVAHVRQLFHRDDKYYYVVLDLL